MSTLIESPNTNTQLSPNNSPDFDPDVYWPKVEHGKTVKWDKSKLNLTPPPTGH